MPSPLAAPAARTLVLSFCNGPTDEAGEPLAPPPALPHLAALLGRLDRLATEPGEVEDPIPPHERALARAWGWSAELPPPLAAARARALGLQPAADEAWGLLQPVHWAVGREHVRMGDPEALGLDEAAGREVFDAIAPLFRSAGWALHWGGPTAWFLVHPDLDGLATASPDRVIGRNPDRWMPEARAARSFRRLQAEVQMTLYTHPLNAAREARGLPVVNSVWLSGCGKPQPVAPGVIHLDALRAPSLAQDVTAWQAAWQQLDAGPLAQALADLQAGQALSLWLCGERSAAHFGPRPRGWLRGLRARWQAPAPAAVLAAL